MDSLDSDFDSLSESCSSEDQEDIESLFGGQARTIFSSLEETIEKIDDFLLFERGFSHGDIVFLASDPSSQMGKVINLDISVDLENTYGYKIPNISSKQLRRMHSISVADYVILGAWLGKVEKSVDCVTVLFDDGTKCRLSAEGPEKIIPISTDLVDDPQYPFYPGQRVRIESSCASRSTRWLCDSKKDKEEQGTVCNVDAGLVHVEWLNCAVMDGEKRTPPPCLQDSKNLSVLPSFAHASWQLGDCCVLPAELRFPSAHTSHMLKDNQQSCMSVPTLDPSTQSQQIAFIVKTKTKVDVQWQDGNESHGLDSSLLFPVNVVDAHDFFPDAFVLEKGTDDDTHGPWFKRWGVVKSVDPKERTVKVKWCKSSPDSLDPDGQVEEVVSAYELVEHPDYSYSLGEPVFRVDEGVFHPTGGEADLKVEASENGGEQNEHLSRNFLCYFGTVVGFKHGKVEVKWATGAISKVAPYEIRKVDKCESSRTESVLGDENVQQPNEELPDKRRDDNVKDSTLSSISQVTMGIFTSIASSLFGSLCTSLISACRCASEDGHTPGRLPEEEALELCKLNPEGELQAADNFEMTEPLEIKEAEVDIVLHSSSKHLGSFKLFDIVNDCSDHHFVQQSEMDIRSLQVKQSWLKKVHREWSILESDLPETICVRVYEERMALLRSAVVGTAGTPYHDGLFFFDIYLPPQYPNGPPMVHYNSGGLRINPNLYESGKVCLSLLNTWSGSQSEVWNPGSSTILQVLLSLQALVLNERPYFNEAGFHMQIGRAEGEKNSISYNENAFLVNCRSMLYLLRKPPKHFEALVEEHFSRRCRNILSACEAYLQGAPVGYPFTQMSYEQETQKGSSTGFKIMLDKLYPKLVEAFSEKGFDCSGSPDQVP